MSPLALRERLEPWLGTESSALDLARFGYSGALLLVVVYSMPWGEILRGAGF